MIRHVYRAARLTLLFPLLALFVGLFWCVYFTKSSIVIPAIAALLSAILVFMRERIAAIWRQTLILEDDRVVYFDGQTRHEIRFAEIKRIRVGRWGGNFRVRQNAGHSLTLLLYKGEIKCWDVSDFSLNVVFQLVCELARRADWPPIEICQTEFQNLKAELHHAMRGLRELSPKPLDNVDEMTRSFWEKEIRLRERCYLLTPHH